MHLGAQLDKTIRLLTKMSLDMSNNASTPFQHKCSDYFYQDIASYVYELSMKYANSYFIHTNYCEYCIQFIYLHEALYPTIKLLNEDGNYCRLGLKHCDLSKVYFKNDEQNFVL